MSFGKTADKDTDCAGKYFIVEPGSPVHRSAGLTVFDNRPLAIKAAYSLAAQYPDRQFCVCKVVGSAKTSKPPIAYTDYDSKKKVK